MMISKALFAATVLAAATFGATAPSLVQAVRAAPDGKQGMAIMSARVSSTGALLNGAGAVSSTKILTGQYKVVFDRPVPAADCVYAPHITTIGYAYIYNVGADNEVYVATRDTLLDLKNMYFNLLVFCAR